MVERCDGSKPARPYIDVDAPADASAEELETIVDACAEEARRWGAPADKLAPVVNACDREKKRSRHLIADGWAVPDGLAVQQFADGVKTRLLGTRAAEWIDRSGGRLSYGLRVAGCPKAGDVAATLSGPLTWVQTEGEPVVDPPNAEPTTKPPRGDSPGGETREYHTTQPITLPTFPAEDAEPAGQTPAKAAAFLSRFLNAIALAFVGVYEQDPSAASAGNVVASFDRIAPGYCSACEKEHDRAGAYVSKAPDGSLFLRCRRTPKNGPPLRSKLRKRVATPAAEPDADTFDDLAAGEFETVGGPGTYNAEAIGGACAAWDLYAASAWGTGKSQHNAAIVRALLERKPRAVILIISSRKSLSAQLAHDIGAVSYDRIRGNLDPKATPVSVWQLDSLGRIGPDVVPELVIVDELSQLTAHAWQNQNGGGNKAAAGVSSLRALVQRAGRVIVSDNDLTAAQVEAFKKLRPGKAARVVRNAFQPWAATSVKVLTGEKASPNVRAKLWEFLDAQHAARAAGLPWEAAAAPCHSLKVARALAEEAAQRYGADAVRIYTSETDDGQKRRDFSDAGAAWDPADGLGPLLVVYTSTVSVGVSCPSARFSHCFAFFSASNCAATQSAQMLFRCRKLRAVLVAYDGKPRHDLPQQPADLFRWVVGARNLAALPDAFRNDRNPFVTTPTASDPEALAEALRGNFEGSLWVANSMEVNRSARWFVPRLRRIIERAGMAVTVEAAGGLAVDQAAARASAAAEEAGAEADRKRAELMAGEMTRRHVAAVDAAEMGRDPDDDRADKTAGDKAGDRARYIARDLRKDPAELAAHFEALAVHLSSVDPEGPTAPQMLAQWLAAYEDIAPAYRRACRVVGLGPTLAAGAGALAVRSSLEADELTRETFATLGAEPCAASLTVETAALLAEPVINLARRINAHASRLFDDRHGAERAKALAGTQSGRRRQAAASSLNTVLAQVGAELRPEYDTARAKKQGTPSRFRLAWLWATAPEPQPEHPTKPEPRHCAARASPADAADITTAAAAFEHIAAPCAALSIAPQSKTADDASELAREWAEKALTA